MSDVHESTFIIAREDRAVSPKTILSDGLRIGRLPDSDVWLNHPTVSRLHAGISKIEDYFYLINLSASSATTLNGRAIPFNESDALVDGDLVRPWPFAIFIWALLIVGTLSGVAAFAYKSAFTPQPLSTPHSTSSFALTPAIAKQSAGGSCTSCHALGVSLTNRERMNANCASCHQTESFAASIIPPHPQ